jgi:hypothetical protein
MTMDFHLREERGGEMRRSSMRGSQEFAAGLAYFRGTRGPDAVRRIRGEWGQGDNLTAFQTRHQELVARGVPDDQARLIAAHETTTGEWATGAGFGRLVGVTVDENGVTATFEPGPSNKPPVPGETDTAAGPAPAPRRTPAGPTRPDPRDAAHQQLLDELRAGMTTSLVQPPAPGPPLQAGEVGRFDSPASAYQAFRDAVGRAGGREVGLFHDPRSRTYAVVVGNEGSVNPPDTGGPWDCPIHTHPNREGVLTYRMPAPQDVFGTWREAMRSDRTAVGFVEYPLPDGRRGMSRVAVEPDGRVTFEWPDANGELRTESLTIEEYQRRWDERTRYVEPGSDQYRQFLQDMADVHRQNRQQAGFGSRTATGPAPVSRLPYVRRRLQGWREEAANDPATPDGTLRVIDDLIAEADRIELGLRDGTVDPQAVDELQADITRYRRQLRRGPGPASRSDEPDYEVRLELSDPAVRADVVRWFETESTELLGVPLGEHLRARMLEQLASVDEIVLQQSPRAAGTGVAGTAAMRRQVTEWIDAGRYPQELAEAFVAARGADGWPVSADGRAWEVDHVLELWAGGEDSPANYVPLHPDLHRIKSEIWARFRRRFRDQLAQIGEQVDTREHGPLDAIPEPVGN